MTKKINSMRSEVRVSLASSAAVLIGALISNQAVAQKVVETTDVDAQVQSEQGVEEVVIYGIKQSLKNAQDLKRDASTVMDAITSSDITSLPDRSVVDALTRVPGVTVEVFEATDDPEHFGAEGSTALVRGLNRTLTQFNGRTSFSATQWGSLNLSHIPSELVGAIEVQKNQTASMIEGGIAGTLNLVTRKPFDSPDMVLGGSIKVDYADEAEEWSPSLSGLFSNAWDTEYGEFGFLVSVAYSDTSAKSEAIGTHDYYERSARDEVRDPEGNLLGVGTPIPGAEADDVYWLPPSIQARAKEDTRDRIGFASSLQWRNPDDTVLATLEFIRSDGHAIWSERLVQNKDQLGDQLGNTSISNVVEIPGVSGLTESFDPSTGLFTHGVLSGAEYAPETRYHDEKTYVNDLSLDVEWQASDNLTISGDIQYVDSGQEMFDHTIHSYFQSDTWLDFRDKEAPQIGFLGGDFRQLTAEQAAATTGTLMQDANGNYWGGNTSTITDPNNIYTRSAMDHHTDSSGDALAFAVNADYELEDSWITNIKAGVRFSSRDQLHKSTEYDWGVISPEWSPEDRRSVADYPKYQEVFNFGSGFHGGDAFVDGSVTSFYLPKLEWVKDLTGFEDSFLAETLPLYDPDADDNAIGPDDDSSWNYTQADSGDDTTDTFVTLERQEVEGKAPGSPFGPMYIFNIEEKTSAAYVQLDFDFVDLPMPIKGNVGLRYVDIDVTTKGSRIFDEPGQWADPQRYSAQTQFINLPSDIETYLDGKVVELARAEAAGEIPNYESFTSLDWLNGYSELVSVKPKKYSSVLPSLNVSVNLTEDLLLRFGASKAIYVPHLALKRAGQRLGANIETNYVDEGALPTGFDPNVDVVPIESITFNNYTNETIGGSNPRLVPEESINTDLGLEWYFSDVGSVSGVLFRKDMKNLIRKGSKRLEEENPLSEVSKEFVQADTFDNVGEADINGIELSYQQTYDMLPGIWSGLGVQANFTYLDTSEDAEGNIDTSVFGSFVDLPLEGLSPKNYNLIVFYENQYFNTRLAYNFRSEYMLNARDVIGKRPVYNADRAVLDYSITYNVTDTIKLGFDVNNITNEQTVTSYQYTSNGDLSPRNYFVNDRRFTLRLSASL